MIRSIQVALLVLLLTIPTNAADFLVGGDISALPDLEKAGAIYHNSDGKPADALSIFTDHGFNLFRIRLFVNPDHDFKKNYGATQDLPMVLALAKRVKNSGAKFSLAIHYSDTWADPAHQMKPADWKDLPFDQLEQKVFDYTTSVMQAMQTNGTPPDIVEVGNETTAGMLWPDGKLDGKTPEEKRKQWDNYIRLEKAGIRAVRAQLPKARIMIHISSGGKDGVPVWFFENFNKSKPDFDIIGLSFYPTWNDSIDGLKKNLSSLSEMDKDILIIEAAYPYKPVNQTPQTTWPMTPAGQKQFIDDVIAATKVTPNHRGIGVCWWYAEAISIPHHGVWENGSLALFDQSGNPLPAMNLK